MFIKQLHINKFRLFQNNDFMLGRYITAIAGFNATGKSTLLALLGHCGELKGIKPLLSNAFKVELSEILKFSPIKDEKIPDLGKVIFDDIPIQALNTCPINYPQELCYRSTSQKYKDGKRYRIIPKKTSIWSSSSKIPWPTLYLGLARLYPLGESLGVKVNPTGKLTPTEEAFIIDNAKSILGLNEIPKGFTTASIAETNKKKAVGLNTDTYDYLANSAGQDNLGQILMAVLSFRRLKNHLGANWYGGLLVVDELDAALHPFAQNKLVDFLYKQAEEIGMQIVFTTHSLGLLDYISIKTAYNNNDTTNNYEIIHLTNANGPIQVVQSPPFEALYKDLMATYGGRIRKIPVFSEDKEAQFVIKRLLEKYEYRFELLDVSFGQDELLRLVVSDFTNFSQYIYILDGDVGDEKLIQYAKKVHPKQLRCVFKLPGGKRPEQVFWDYLNNIPGDHVFFTSFYKAGYTKRSIQVKGPNEETYPGVPERDKYKRWFNDNIELVKDVFDFWCSDNAIVVTNFRNEFINTFNWVAKQSFLPGI
jgi:AAA15 family ATPase/GTPase